MDVTTVVERFARASGVTLRSYQRDIAAAIMTSVLRRQGKTFAVMMARQAGKNEVSAIIEGGLLFLRQRDGGQIVKASPTFQPQVINSMLRLEQRWPAAYDPLKRREGYIYECGQARCLFMSAAPGANVVGATASLLLECDEAQDVDPAKWRKDFLPMAASTNATTVYWGTAWTDRTLLAQVVAELRQVEAATGEQRVFLVDADVVGAEVPAYATYVAGQVAQLGRQHPLIRSQYYLEDIDTGGGLFDGRRQGLMRGAHPRRAEPEPGAVYALLVDVGGAEESARGIGVERALNAKRDATAVTVVEVDYGRPMALPARAVRTDNGHPSLREASHSSVVDRQPSVVGRPSLREASHSSVVGSLPHYRVVDRRVWVGAGHVSLHGELVALARHWRAARVVVDATGIGAGLAQFLEAALGAHRVVRFTFSPASKSSLGWRFLGLVDTGRYQDYIDDGRPDTRQFWYEVGACEFEAQPGGGLRWGVWETPKYQGAIARGHDDLLISAALCAVLDDLPGLGAGESVIIEPVDVLAEADQGSF